MAAYATSLRQSCRGDFLWLEIRQVEEARPNPNFYVYVVENVRQGDPDRFRLKVSMGDAELYDVTGRWWKVGDRARELGSARAPEWAMAVSHGVVRAVYRIEGWEQPSQADIDGDPKRAGRWGFRGIPDPAMEALYLHCDVSSYVKSLDGVPSQNPIRYVGCQR